MNSEPSAGEMVEGGDLSRHQCRRNEARPMRHKIAESVGVSGRIKGNEEALGRRRGMSHECQIEVGFVMRSCKLREIARG